MKRAYQMKCLQKFAPCVQELVVEFLAGRGSYAHVQTGFTHTALQDANAVRQQIQNRVKQTLWLRTLLGKGPHVRDISIGVVQMWDTDDDDEDALHRDKLHHVNPFWKLHHSPFSSRPFQTLIQMLDKPLTQRVIACA